MDIATDVLISGIDPEQLAMLRAIGRDHAGNQVEPFVHVRNVNTGCYSFTATRSS